MLFAEGIFDFTERRRAISKTRREQGSPLRLDYGRVGVNVCIIILKSGILCLVLDNAETGSVEGRNRVGLVASDNAAHV